MSSGIGAMGMNVRTGKVMVFKAKPRFLRCPRPARLWLFNPDLVGLCRVQADAEHRQRDMPWVIVPGLNSP